MKRGWQLFNVTRSTVLATDLWVAESWWERAKGLLGRADLGQGQGLLLPGCRSIHMIGMRFAIDAAFIDRAGQVVALRRSLKPWAMTPPLGAAWGVVELPQGTLNRSATQVGDQLEQGVSP